MEKRKKRQLMNEALTLALRANTDQLLKELSRFDYPKFNQKPTDGGWTGGEIAEHLLLFDIRLNSILSDQTEASLRDPQEKIEEMDNRMSDRKNTIEAPAFLIPSTTSKDPAAMMDKIIVSRNQLIQATRNRELSLLLPNTPHRFFGVLSGIEWINFLIHHTNRHIKQLELL